jgi:PGF-CTERM protein
MAVLIVASSFAAPVSAQQQTDGDLTDDGLLWEGQVLNYSVQDTTNATGAVVVSEDSSYLQEYAIDNGNVTVDSEGMDTGAYELRVQNTNETVSFNVVTQSLSVDVADATDGESTNFTVDSNRANYELVVESDEWNATELEAAFDEDAIEDVRNVDEDAEDELVLSISGSMDLKFDVDADDDAYDFDFSVEDTDATAQATLAVGAQADTDAEFAQNVHTVEMGDSFTFDVELTNTDEARLNIDGPGDAYDTSYLVEDGNDDGVVSVQWESDNMGMDVSAVDADDDVTVAGDSSYPSNELLDMGAYEMNLSLNANWDGSTFTSAGDETDVGVFELVGAGEATMDIGVMPGNAFDSGADADDEMFDAITWRGGDVAVAGNDYVVVKIAGDGLRTYLDGASTAADLDSPTGVYFNVTHENPGINAQPEEYDLSNFEVVYNEDERAAYVFLSAADEMNFSAGDEVAVEYNVGEDSAHADRGAEPFALNTAFELVETNVMLDNEDDDTPIQVAVSNESMVSGTSTLAPGTEYTVLARSTGGDNPFLVDQDVVVQQDGTFAATFDFSENTAGHNFTVKVAGQDWQNAQFYAEAPEPEPEPETYAVSVNATDADGSPVAGATLTIEDADAAALENGTYDYTVTADNYEDVTGTLTVDGADQTVDVSMELTTYALTVDVVDADGNAIENASLTVAGEEFESGSELTVGGYTVYANADGYEEASETVTLNDGDEQVTITLAAEEPEPTEEPTEPPATEEPTSEAPDNSSDDEDDGDSSGETGPGFGIVVALVALVAAALLAARRQE